jgi:hypothetical protein
MPQPPSKHVGSFITYTLTLSVFSARQSQTHQHRRPRCRHHRPTHPPLHKRLPAVISRNLLLCPRLRGNRIAPGRTLGPRPTPLSKQPTSPPVLAPSTRPTIAPLSSSISVQLSSGTIVPPFPHLRPHHGRSLAGNCPEHLTEGPHAIPPRNHLQHFPPRSPPAFTLSSLEGETLNFSCGFASIASAPIQYHEPRRAARIQPPSPPPFTRGEWYNRSRLKADHKSC